jgi:acetyl esterase
MATTTFNFSESEKFNIHKISPNPEIKGIDPALGAPLPSIPLTIEELRKTPSFPATVPVKDISIPSREEGVQIPARIYTPNSSAIQTLPIFVYFHGGGWVRGTLDLYNYICSKLSALGFIVVSVAYRLAPEVQYPILVNDCIDSIKWTLKNSNTLRGTSGDPLDYVVIGGDSAGGYLTICSLLTIIHNEGQIPSQITAQCLVYPATDPHMKSSTWPTLGKDYRLTEEFVKKSWLWFLGNESVKNDHLANLAKCDSALVSKLPPALVITAEFDPLNEEGEIFAERMFTLGVKTHCFRILSTIHGFFSNSSATGFPQHEPYSNLAINLIEQWKSTLNKK